MDNEENKELDTTTESSNETVSTEEEVKVDTSSEEERKEETETVSEEKTTDVQKEEVIATNGSNDTTTVKKKDNTLKIVLICLGALAALGIVFFVLFLLGVNTVFKKANDTINNVSNNVNNNENIDETVSDYVDMFNDYVDSAKEELNNDSTVAANKILDITLETYVGTKDGRSFVVADLPGLIEGASEGEGLGDKFLRHIERTKVIAHVLDMAGSEGRNPYDDFILINKELEAFNEKLIKKPMIIIANKMDLPEAKENLEEFKKKVDLEIFEVSAATNTGLQKVVDHLANMLDEIPNNPLYDESQIESHVLYKFKKEEPYTITRDDDGVWVISGKEVEKLFKMTKFSSDEAVYRFAKKLRRMGIDDKLIEMGAEPGDQVRILDFYFDFKD